MHSLFNSFQLMVNKMKGELMLRYFCITTNTLDTPEVLGDAYGVCWCSLKEAQEVLEELEDTAEEYGLAGITYSIEELDKENDARIIIEEDRLIQLGQGEWQII